MPEDEEKPEAKQEPQEEWKVRFKDGTVFAPVTYDNLLVWFKSGQIDADTPVAKNNLAAEWVPFKQTGEFAEAQAAKEGKQVFCISCGAAWPAGTKFCTKCGTNLETGEKISAAGEKKPERIIKLGRKKKDVAPEQAGVATPPEAAVAAEPPQAEEALPKGEVEAPAPSETAEAAAPARREKRGKKKVIRLVIGVAAIVVAVAVLAPDKMSDIVEKVKRLVGAKHTPSKEQEEEEQKWAEVGEDARSAIEHVQSRLSSALSILPFSQGQRAAFEGETAEFLRGAVDEFTDTDAFVSLATVLAEGNLREAASFLEEEKSLLGKETSTPRIDAMQGAIQILLGKENKGMPLLVSAIEEADIARAAASFCRGAVEGCLERLLPPQGRKDPWATVAEILGMKKEDFGDEFLARRCGKALSGLVAVEALTGESPAGPLKAKKVGAKSLLGLFKREDPSVLAAEVELGKTDPAKRPSALKDKPVRAAYALRLMSVEEQEKPGADVKLADALKEGLSADPDNAFYNYALAAVYLGMKRDKEAMTEIAAGNQKPAYRDYSKERMEGLAKVLDTTLPYTAATMKISSPHLLALASSSQRLLESAWSSFRVGRREEVFEMLGQWRKVWERLRGRVCSFKDALTVVNASVPPMAAEAEFCRRDARRAEAWKIRKALAENWRLALAVEYGAEYGPPAEVFVKEVLSEKDYGEEFSGSLPQMALAGLWAKAAVRLDEILGQDPSSVAVQGANLQDRYYVAAKTALDGNRYEKAFEYANQCLGQNPKHIWALKVMQTSLAGAGAESETPKAKAVVYRVLKKRDLSLPGAKRLEYDIQVAQRATKDEAIATARSALQGFWKKEKAGAVRIYVMQEGNPLPYVRLTWAPGGDWAKAKEGTPYAEFEENLKTFEKAL